MATAVCVAVRRRQACRVLLVAAALLLVMAFVRTLVPIALLIGDGVDEAAATTAFGGRLAATDEPVPASAAAPSIAPTAHVAAAASTGVHSTTFVPSTATGGPVVSATLAPSTSAAATLAPSKAAAATIAATNAAALASTATDAPPPAPSCPTLHRGLPGPAPPLHVPTTPALANVRLAPVLAPQAGRLAPP